MCIHACRFQQLKERHENIENRSFEIIEFIDGADYSPEANLIQERLEESEPSVQNEIGNLLLDFKNYEESIKDQIAWYLYLEPGAIADLKILEDTKNLAGNAIETREIDILDIGDRVVRIYELMGRKGELNATQ